MSKFSVFVKSCRLVIGLVSLLFFIFGFYLSGSDFNWQVIVYGFFLLIPYGFILYGVNDVYDYESDKRNPRKGSAQGNILEKKYHSFVLKTSTILSIIFLLFSLTINSTVFIVTLAFILFSYIYSVPPLRLKTRPPLDSILNGFGYSLFFLSGLYFGGFIHFRPDLILALFLCIMAGHAFSTVPDYESDKKAKDRTFAVEFGKRFTVIFSGLIYILVALLTPIQTKILVIVTFIGGLLMILSAFNPSKKTLNLVLKLIFLEFIILVLYFTIKFTSKYL